MFIRKLRLFRLWNRREICCNLKHWRKRKLDSWKSKLLIRLEKKNRIFRLWNGIFWKMFAVRFLKLRSWCRRKIRMRRLSKNGWRIYCRLKDKRLKFWFISLDKFWKNRKYLNLVNGIKMIKMKNLIGLMMILRLFKMRSSGLRNNKLGAIWEVSNF